MSCLRPPAGIDPQALVKRLASRGWTVGGGYGDWKPSTFRIGHMGEVRESDLEALLGEIDDALAEIGEIGEVGKIGKVGEIGASAGAVAAAPSGREA